MHLQSALFLVPLLFQAAFASPTVQHVVERATSSQPLCGVIGYDCGKYLLNKAQCSVAQCEALCKKNSKCKSYGYGQKTCRLYSAAVKDNVTRKSGSPYKFYDKACPCPSFATAQRTTTSAKQATTTSSTTSQKTSTTSVTTTRATTTTVATTTASTTTSAAATTTSACPATRYKGDIPYFVFCDAAYEQRTTGSNANLVRVISNVESLYACIDECNIPECNAVNYIKDGRNPSYGAAMDCVLLKNPYNEIRLDVPGIDLAAMPGAK